VDGTLRGVLSDEVRARLARRSWWHVAFLALVLVALPAMNFAVRVCANNVAWSIFFGIGLVIGVSLVGLQIVAKLGYRQEDESGDKR
jgi:multidrug transporter EmrE-like cation transporter